jgi:hypothetical protein
MKQRIMMVVFSLGLAAGLIVGGSSGGQAGMISLDISQTDLSLPPDMDNLPFSVEQPSIFKFVRTVQLTPDENFNSAAMGCLHYIPATDRIVALLQTWLTQPVTLPNTGEVCTQRAVGYKEYYPDMTPTGNHGFFACSMTDLSSQMIGNTLYFARFKENLPPESPVWILAKFNAVTWEKQGEIEIPLDYPYERVGGMTVGYVNGQIVMSGDYWAGGESGGPTHSHHHFFSPDLAPLGEKLLLDIQHIPMLSLIETESAIVVLGSTSLDGDLLMMKYDKSWNYIESKIIKPQAHFPQGAVWDGSWFYFTYADSSQRINDQWYPNVHLAVYNDDWNALDDVAVTTYLPSDPLQPAGHWVLKHGNQLYVAYIEVHLNPDGSIDDRSFQTYVNIYELIHNVYLPLVLRNY